MKHILKIICLIAVLVMAVPAMAAPLNNDYYTNVLQKVKQGALTLKAPADVVLPDVTVSSQVEATNVTALDFEVDDARGYKVPHGWSATVTMGKLASATQGTDIPFVDPVTTNKDYKLTPTNKLAYNGAVVTEVVLGSAEELVENGTSGVSNAKTVMTAAAGGGKGRFGCDVVIDLKVPANTTAADDYTSDLTFTVS